MLRDHGPCLRRRVHDGAVLIIVLGLSMVLLGIAVTFMMRMRSDSAETRVVLEQAQERIMLHAGLMFLQEESRLGWGKESFGWTDVRDGSLGPRQPRDGTTGGTGAIPAPSWWQAGWGAYKPSPLDADLPGSASHVWPCPGAVVRCPMAVPVQPPYATQLRYAYNPVGFPAGKPAYGQAGWDTAWITAPTGVDPVQRTKTNATLPTTSYWPKAWADTIFDPTLGATAALDPQPQAKVWLDATYDGSPGQTPDFASGAIDKSGPPNGDWWHFVDKGAGPIKVQLQVRPGTENRCWFRIYRELLADHDGDGNPAYDRVVMYDPKDPGDAIRAAGPNANPIKNWNVFIIACGAGATRGYRFWDAADLATWESRNGYAAGTVSQGQEFASTSGLFDSKQDFDDRLASTQMMWFRVEWSAMQGGGFIPEKYSWAGMRIYPRYYVPDPAAPAATKEFMRPRPYPGYNAHANLGLFDEQNSDYIIVGATDGGYADGLGLSAPKTYGGNFRWVQRLDHEPPNW